MTDLHLPDAGEIAEKDLPEAITQVAALQTSLAARLLCGKKQAETPEPEELLTAEEAGQELGVDVTWLYRHAKTLPFARRLSRKCLRFSKRGLLAWRDRKRG